MAITPSLQSASVSADSAAAWYAVLTRSRHEHVVERFLQMYSVVTYLPLRRVWSTRKDRRKRIEVAALPGYLFLSCRLTPELRASIKKVPGVVGFVSWDGQPSRIPTHQVESLRILLASDQDVQMEAHFEVGQTVRIKSGPLKGSCGTLSRTNPGRHRLVVSIDYVGLAFSADVHEADVEPVT